MYSFIAVPEEVILKKLNEIRKYLYVNGFRYSNVPPTSDVHVSLFHFENYPEDPILNELQKLINNYSKITINQYSLVNRPHDEKTNKVDKPSNWISVTFKSDELKQKAAEMLLKLGIDQTVSADHMNLCNYAKPEKSQEAIEYINSLNLPKVITLDRIAIRNDHGDLLWSQRLN